MKPESRRYFLYAAILVLGVSIGARLMDWRVSSLLDGTYRYDIEVTVTDATTGEKVPNPTVESPSVGTSQLFQQSTGMSGGNDGTVGISGIAYEPRTWKFGSEGYYDKALTINDESERSITINLEPKKQNKGGDGDAEEAF